MVQAAEPVREMNSGAADREAVAVTVYNDDLALVKERRRVDLPAGMTRLSLREVAARMRPETALLRAVSGPPLGLIEQNFDFDLLTPQKLLEKYVGREVTVIRPHPTSDAERREKATVLAAGQGTVLRFADRIETGVPGRLAFDSVPPNLRDRPTLSVLLAASGGKQAVELSYLTGGLSWKADYVANLSTDGKSLDLNGWVTLTNRSGAGFDDARLQLVAGTVNRVRQADSRVYAMAAPAPARAKAQEATQEALLDYHLYSFERPTSIADNQTKQLALLSASAVPVPGLDWAVDAGMLSKLIPEINREFGLTPQQLDQLDPKKRDQVQKAVTLVGSVLIGKFISRDLILKAATKIGMRLTTKQLAKYVPFAGQIVAATVGYAAIRYLGEEHMKDCIRVAQQAQLEVPLLGYSA